MWCKIKLCIPIRPQAKNVFSSHEKEWLLNQINRIPNKTYLLFDFPGQAELYSGIVLIFGDKTSSKGHISSRHFIILHPVFVMVRSKLNMTESA